MSDCKGLKFRASSKTFFGKQGTLDVRKSIRLLKRNSCNNCSECHKIMETIQEFFKTPHSGDILKNIDDKKMYKLEINNNLNENINIEDSIKFIEVDEDK
jgi:hypothetical protein